MDWENSNVEVTNWPDSVQLPDGRWERVWRFSLVKPTQRPEAAARTLKHLLPAGCTAEVEIEGTNGKLVLRSDRWPGESDLHFLASSLFWPLEEALGEFDRVQGQPKRLWKPWRDTG